MRCCQKRSDHRSRGGLAVGSGNGDAVFQAHQFREHLCARDHRNLPVVRFDDFRIVGLHGGGSHLHVGAIGVRRLVTPINRGAQVFQPFRDVRKLYVGPGNGIAQGQKDFGDAAHADAADADQMNALEIAKGDHHGFALILYPARLRPLQSD